MNGENAGLEPGAAAPLLPLVTWDEVRAEAQAVRESILGYTSLSLIGTLIADAVASASSSGAYDFPNVEYAALVLWHEQQDRNDAIPIRGAQVEELSGALKRLFFAVSRYYGSEEQRDAGDPARADISHRLRAAGLGIRVPAYEVHQKRVLRGLFEPFAADLRASLSFSIEDVISCFEGMHDLVDPSLARFRRDARGIDSQEAMDDHCELLGDYLSFDAADVAALNGADAGAYHAVLNAFALNRGEPDVHALIPSPFSILREQPILRIGDGRFIVPSHALLFPAAQARLERFLNTTLTPGAVEGLWIRYQDHRGAWVEQEADRLLRVMMPGGDGIIGGYYQAPVVDPVRGVVQAQVESDVTYNVDDALFLVEGKAGSFTPATFRGGAGSISTDVKAIITKGHEQCARTEAYVRAGNRTLENQDGSLAFTIRDPIREIFRIVVTLDNAGVLATATAVMQRAGFMAGQPSWTLSLTDLMVLSETLPRPGEFRHYARRRYESMMHEHVIFFDETDPLGLYFLHNDMTIMYGEVDTVMLSGYNDSLDGHYVKEEIPSPPSLAVPAEVVSLIEALARLGAPSWTEAVCDLFALGAGLDEVARQIAERIDTDRPRDFTFGENGKGLLTVLVMPGEEPATLIRWFVAESSASPNRPVGKRLFIGYDPLSRMAQADYRERVHENYYLVPPALWWTSSLTNR